MQQTREQQFRPVSRDLTVSKKYLRKEENNMILSAACSCHHGRVRENNEDNLYFNGEILPLVHMETKETLSLERNMDESLCFAVFDGMGGEQNGEEASYLTAQVCRERMPGLADKENPADILCQVLMEANERICRRTREKRLRRMGSTAALLFFDRKQVWICNIGDSRIYRLRGREFIQCSVDHTDRALVKRQGGHRKPYLTQHLGIFPEEMRIEPYCTVRDVRGGDIYLICSDGLTDMLTDEEIGEIFLDFQGSSTEGKPESRHRKNSMVKVAEQLRDAALERGGRDNITVQVIKIEDRECREENKLRRIVERFRLRKM